MIMIAEKKKDGKLCDNQLDWRVMDHIWPYLCVVFTGKIQLMAKCWCGARWFRFLGYP